MIDQDRDGVISVGDLQSIYMQIGMSIHITNYIERR